MTETLTAPADETEDGENATPDLFTSADVTWSARITYRQLDYWVRVGYLKPERAACGSGVPRRWPRLELDVARNMGRLVRLGLPLENAHRIARSGEPRTEVAPNVWLELGPPLSPHCDRGDCEGCFPEEPGTCGHGCHDSEGQRP